MRCEIDCRLTAAGLSAERGELSAAAALIPEIEDLLHRAIECGAMVDPWNILGFGGQFSKFPAVEDSIHDHRVDELIELMNEIFGLYALLQREAAAVGDGPLRERLSDGLNALAQWWDRFASTEVSGVESVSGRQAWESACQVAEALRAWHEAGTAAGNVAFWRRHVETFHSPKAYAMLVDDLLRGGDLVAAMALLVQWLGRAGTIPLAENGYSFYTLAIRWMESLWSRSSEPESSSTDSAMGPRERSSMARKFLDFIEANADEYWQVPVLELDGRSTAADTNPAGTVEEEATHQSPSDDEDDLFSAAYENVTYRDTTDDGFESELLEGGAPATDFELAREGERIGDRLAFLGTLARLWKQTALASSSLGSSPPNAPRPASPGRRESEPASHPPLAPGANPPADREELLAGWLTELAARRRQLGDLLTSVHRYPIRTPHNDHQSLVEFDRRRGIKEMLPRADHCRQRRDARRRSGGPDRQRPAPARRREGVVGNSRRGCAPRLGPRRGQESSRRMAAAVGSLARATALVSAGRAGRESSEDRPVAEHPAGVAAALGRRAAHGIAD